VLFAPRGTPKQVVDKMHAELAAALREPDVTERLRQSDQEVIAASPADTAARLAVDSKTWGIVAKRIGLQAD